MGLAGFHPRLTVLQAGPHERTSLTEHLARLLLGAASSRDRLRNDPQGGTDDPLPVLTTDDLEAFAREMADQRAEDHVRLRTELSSTLRAAQDAQSAAGTRRDEAATRARRMASYLDECDALLSETDSLTDAVENAARELDERHIELEEARDRLAVVLDQRDTATAAIEDARAQLQELEASEVDESTLRRRLEQAGHELREAEAAHAEAAETLQQLEARAYEREAAREQIAQERAELAERIEAPLYDPTPVRDALEAFDDEARTDEADPVAEGLATEWLEVTDELERIEAALPPPPSQGELSTAEQQLGEIEGIVAELEATSRHSRLDPAARADIEAAHEAVLAAEEALDQSEGHPDVEYQLEAARADEQQVLAQYGYTTYLDVVMAEPEPSEAEAELLDALRARRHAEDTLASLWAATEPPSIVLTLQSRGERIYREASELLCCDPGDNIVELLEAHPEVPAARTRDLADVLASYGVYPSGVSVRDAAIDLLLGIDREADARESLLQEVERLDAELIALDEQEANEAGEGQELMQVAHAAAADVEAIAAEVHELEMDLRDRSAHDERRIQRAAAADELRAQIAAVSEALERSDDEYHARVAEAEAATAEAEDKMERATAGVSDTVRKLRSISDALPPALRPKFTDDPLAELPRLQEVLGSEVERAEAALTSASRELERTQRLIEETETNLENHNSEHPPDDVLIEDFTLAVGEMLGEDDAPVVLDDPFGPFDDHDRIDLLDALAEAASQRPVVLLTDDPNTLSWAISLPEEIGTVTGLPVDHDGVVTTTTNGSDRPVADPGAVAPSSP